MSPRFRPRPAMHQRPHMQRFPHEAEVKPKLNNNVVYFQQKDVVSHRRPINSIEAVEKFKPGVVSDATLSSSENRPIIAKGPTVAPSGYRFTVVGYSTPEAPNAFSTTTKHPTVLHPVTSTPTEKSTTHNTVVKPAEPTESVETIDTKKPTEVIVKEEAKEPESAESLQMNDMINANILSTLDMVPPAPIPMFPNSFNILESAGDSKDKKSIGKKDKIYHARPVFEPKKKDELKVEEITTTTTTTTKAPETFTSTSVSMSVSSPKKEVVYRKDKPVEKKKYVPSVEEEEEEDDSLFSFLFSSPKKSKKKTTTVRPNTTTSTTTPKTTTTMRTTTTTTTTKAPTTTSTTTTTTTTTEAPSTSTAFPRLPAMPAYKRKPKPVYSRKGKSQVSGISKAKLPEEDKMEQKEVDKKSVSSGEIVMITAGRSKVKEYKPQFITNGAQLLSFDTVAEDQNGTQNRNANIASGHESSVVSIDDVSSLTSPSSTTTKSPLQEFDPMKLLHSWFKKP